MCLQEDCLFYLWRLIWLYFKVGWTSLTYDWYPVPFDFARRHMTGELLSMNTSESLCLILDLRLNNYLSLNRVQFLVCSVPFFLPLSHTVGLSAPSVHWWSWSAVSGVACDWSLSLGSGAERKRFSQCLCAVVWNLTRAAERRSDQVTRAAERRVQRRFDLHHLASASLPPFHLHLAYELSSYLNTRVFIFCWYTGSRIQEALRAKAFLMTSPVSVILVSIPRSSYNHLIPREHVALMWQKCGS